MMLHAGTYAYPLSVRLMACLGVPVIALLGIGLGVGIFMEASQPIGILMMGGGLFLLLSAVMGISTYAAISVTSEGIASSLFGWVLNSVRWQDISSIRKFRQWNPGAGRYHDSYYVCDSDRTSPRPLTRAFFRQVTFNDYLNELPALLDAITAYSGQYGFPLILVDGESRQTRPGWLPVRSVHRRLSDPQGTRVDRF